MTIIYSSRWNDRDSFEEHAERMGMFRKSHPDVAMVNAPRRDGPALLESMRPLQVHCTMMETGGSSDLIGAVAWSALVPLCRVAQYRLSQN